jgi:hypothetical protein
MFRFARWMTLAAMVFAAGGLAAAPRDGIEVRLSAAAALAISDPVKALDNADSHEYFAENTPALP